MRTKNRNQREEDSIRLPGRMTRIALRKGGIGLEDPAIDPWKMEDLALRSTLLLENPPPEDDNEAVGKEDDGDFPGTTPILWKPPLAELERRLEEQDRRSIIVDPLRIPVLQGRGPPWAKRRRRKRGEKGKRSTACMRRCMTQGLLHPAQCHSLC
ncbi:unnamed protein product [Darwinula stevensoni]|uniref:Uncharacterized protein n=1 Tax=Darwinula stevensoni TaxID=69355 RepID=A0A7R9A4F7_9CRUS|nr:unnamed protein product [Darwinula stevensoni]CAG0892457.1 unnamed protein product [Darwinula stevensoni]